MSSHTLQKKQPIAQQKPEEEAQEGKSLAPPAFQLKASETATEEPWIPEVGPDGHVVLRAEEGDSLESLLEWFKNSKLPDGAMANLMQVLADQGADLESGNVIASSSIDLTSSLGGDWQKMTSAINSKDHFGSNCAETAFAMGSGREIDPDRAIDPNTEADDILMRDFNSVPIGKAIAGRTVIRNATPVKNPGEHDGNNRPLHYSVFLGIDRSGNIYVFTKNSVAEDWDIQVLGQFHEPGNPDRAHKNYGEPMPIDSSERKDPYPFYNYR